VPFSKKLQNLQPNKFIPRILNEFIYFVLYLFQSVFLLLYLKMKINNARSKKKDATFSTALIISKKFLRNDGKYRINLAKRKRRKIRNIIAKALFSIPIKIISINSNKL
jgi:hypothetical protein